MNNRVREILGALLEISRLDAGAAAPLAAAVVAAWTRGCEGFDDAGAPIVQADREADALARRALASRTEPLAFVAAAVFTVTVAPRAMVTLGEQQLDAATELEAGRGHMVAIHVKDVRPGEPRRVPMGEGTVDWDESFAILAEQTWRGRMMIEMWNDDAPDSNRRSASARTFIEDHLRAAGIPIRCAVV